MHAWPLAVQVRCKTQVKSGTRKAHEQRYITLNCSVSIYPTRSQLATLRRLEVCVLAEFALKAKLLRELFVATLLIRMLKPRRPCRTVVSNREVTLQCRQTVALQQPIPLLLQRSYQQHASCLLNTNHLLRVHKQKSTGCSLRVTSQAPVFQLCSSCSQLRKVLVWVYGLWFTV